MSAKKPTTKKAVNLTTLRAALDPDIRHPAIIRAGLKAMAVELGAEAYEVEYDFLKRCTGVGNNHVGVWRETFRAHIVVGRPDGKNEKRYWFPDVKVAAKAAKIRGMRAWTPSESEDQA
jgi:hypothetical protein